MITIRSPQPAALRPAGNFVMQICSNLQMMRGKAALSPREVIQ